MECDYGPEGSSNTCSHTLAAALSAGNATVTVCAAAAAASKNSNASACNPVTSQNAYGAIKGVDQIVHDPAYLAHNIGSRDHATKSIDQIMHDNPSYQNRMHEAGLKHSSFQATKSMDQMLHDDQDNPICKDCSRLIDPSSSTTCSMYPKGVKLAPMINCKQVSVVTSTSLFEGCTSVNLKLGSSTPSIEQLKLFQPIQTIPWKFTVYKEATSPESLQALDESSQSFTVNTDRWKHL